MLLWLILLSLSCRCEGAPACPALAGVDTAPAEVNTAPAGAHPAPAQAHPVACRVVPGSSDETQFYIHDKTMVISHWAGESLTVKCQGADLSDLSVLPAFRHERAVVRVLALHACPLPRIPLSDVLRALNATLRCARPDSRPCELQLSALPPEPALSAAHFARLENLERLDVAAEYDAPARPEPGFLAPLRRLRRLALRYVALPELELSNYPPPALRHLELTHAGVRNLPPAWLDALEVLSDDSEAPLNLQRVPDAVRNLTLRSPATNLSLDAAPALLALDVDSWTEVAPRPLASCPELRVLGLTRPAIEALPAGWLQECKMLERLSLEHATRLVALPAELLAGAAGLHTLQLRGGTVRALPVLESGAQLLDHGGALQHLDLSGNNLHELPSGTFNMAKKLRRLMLSYNNLTADALRTLQPLEHLEEVDLSYNSNLRDFCSSRLDMSPLHVAKGLKRLILEGTGASLVCRDWCQYMPHLERLNLKNTHVSELWFQDVRCERQVAALVDLRGTPVSLLYTNVTDYERAGNGSGASYAQVELDSPLSCDCDMYWTRRALPSLQHVKGLRCAGGRALQDVPPDIMQCVAPEECAAFPALPAACTCSARPGTDPHARTMLVSVQCERAGLTRVPAPRARFARRYRLLLAHNNITELAATDLYDEIEDLDLSDNGLTGVKAAAAVRLAHLAGTLRLTDNLLECSCHAAPLLRALHARPAELPGLQCADGSPLEEAAVADCPLIAPAPSSGWRVAAALATLLALALVVLAALASRERRFFLKAVLLRWGLLWRPREPAEDEARTYDAFVTFSHEDEAMALQLVARLEPAYRLCVHYRDWTPGRLIAEQVLESVQRSRRTLALVSRHFLASAWACAEFQSAHEAALRDARHRLVVVLLEAPEALPRDARLHQYLASNTYVRWQDPWLWDKLRVALPPPRTPTVSPTIEPTVSSNSTPPKHCLFPTCTSTVPNVSPTCGSSEPNVSLTSAAPPDINIFSTYQTGASDPSVSPTRTLPDPNVSLTRAPSEPKVFPNCALPEPKVSPICTRSEPHIPPICTRPEADIAVPSTLGAEPNVPNVSPVRDSLATGSVTYIAPVPNVSREDEIASPHCQPLKVPRTRATARDSIVLDMPPTSVTRPIPCVLPLVRERARNPAPRAVALAT